MTPKEIFESMSKDTWFVVNYGGFHTAQDYPDYSGTPLLDEEKVGELAIANGEAMCLCVNHTILKGFDPTKVSEMYEMLESFERIHPLWLPPESVSPEHTTEAEALCSMHRKLKDLLKSCKL